jgi:hypothetical protein
MKKLSVVTLALAVLMFSASCALPFASAITSSEGDKPEVRIEGQPASTLPECLPEDGSPAAPAKTDGEYEVITEPDPTCGELGTECSPSTLPDSEAPNSVPARPGTDVTSDPSANLPDLVEVNGTVKEVKQGLVLITLADGGGDFMLRFSEHSKFAEGVGTELKTGSTVRCLVKPEPTFAPPAQGEVYEVLSNQ